MADVDLVWNEPEVERLLYSDTGPVGRYMGRQAENVTQGAKRRCPVYVRPGWMPAGWPRSPQRPSGYVRSKIYWRRGRDAVGIYVDVVSPATTLEGAPLGLFLEVGTKPHQITARNAPYLVWPGRSRTTGDVYIGVKRTVDHPGTPAQPYLRPSLGDVRAP